MHDVHQGCIRARAGARAGQRAAHGPSERARQRPRARAADGLQLLVRVTHACQCTRRCLVFDLNLNDIAVHVDSRPHAVPPLYPNHNRGDTSSSAVAVVSSTHIHGGHST